MCHELPLTQHCIYANMFLSMQIMRISQTYFIGLLESDKSGFN